MRALWPLEATVAHLNHGSFGAVPTPVLEEQQSWRDRMEANPVRFFARELDGALDQARGEVAQFLGVEDDAVAFVPNVTTAVSTVLSCLPLASGDQVLMTDHTYGAIRIAVTRWAEAARAEVVTVHVPLAADEDELCGLLTEAVTERTRLAVLDHVTSPTARRLPLVRLVPELQSRGVAVLVDGAHCGRDARRRPGRGRRRLLDRQPAQVVLRAAGDRRAARRAGPACAAAAAGGLVGGAVRVPPVLPGRRDPGPHGLAVGAEGAAHPGAPRPGAGAPAQRRAGRRRAARGRPRPGPGPGRAAAGPGGEHAAGAAARPGSRARARRPRRCSTASGPRSRSRSRSPAGPARASSGCRRTSTTAPPTTRCWPPSCPPCSEPVSVSHAGATSPTSATSVTARTGGPAATPEAGRHDGSGAGTPLPVAGWSRRPAEIGRPSEPSSDRPSRVAAQTGRSRAGPGRRSSIGSR